MSVRNRKWKNKKGITKEKWVVDVVFEHADGTVTRVQKSSPVNTRRGAEEYERQLRGELLGGTFGREDLQAPFFRDFKAKFVTWSETHNKPSAIHAKKLALKNHLGPAFDHMRLDKICVPVIEKYKAEKLAMKLSPKTVNNHLAMLRKLLNLAVEWNELPLAPKIQQLRVPEQEFRFFLFDEAERFLAAAPPEHKAMLTLALKTGLRLGELLALKWEDVDLKAKKLIVRRSLWQDEEGSPKSGRSREVPLSDAAAEALATHRHLRGDYVFCNEKGERLSHSEVKDVVPRTCRRAGLAKRLTWHDLRHTFASHLVMRGRGLKEVQELLGHATIDMTMRYAHLSPDVKREAVQVLDLPSNTPTIRSTGTQ